MTYEDKYRKQALKMLKRINDTQYYFSCHKPSIGYVGEYLLRQTLQNILTSCYGVCQGFVINDDKLSRQCDIIIYIKGKESIYKSYGELKIVNAESVVAVIEVKSSITKETFLSTLEAFEQLYTLRVTNCFLFVYGQLTQRKLRNWLFSYKNSNTCTEQYIVTDSYLYDWSDMEWLPHSVLALESNKYFKLGHISTDNGDWVGYTALNIKDSKDARISCLQEFFSDIVISNCEDMMTTDIKEYSIEDGIELFRF